MTIIEALKQFNVDRLDLEGLIEASALGRVLQDEVAKLGMEEPEWLTHCTKEVRREIKLRTQDQMEKLLKEKISRLEALKPPEQRREDLTKEIEELKARLTAVQA
jgi:hypothetical protein